MGTIMLIVVVGLLVGLIVAMLIKKFKKKPTPTPSPSPIPTQRPPRYQGFLNNVETVIRNNLPEEELKIFFDSMKAEFDIYIQMPGFRVDFNKLLAKYNIPYPY